MKQSVLFLPRWYPNKFDVQLGIFIREQALLLKEEVDVSVIYVQADAALDERYQITENRSDGITEYLVYFKPGSGIFSKILNANRYKKAQRMALHKLSKKVDLCHVHVPYRSAFLALELLHSRKIPFVITEHWSGHLNGQFALKNPMDKSLYKKVLSKAAGISCVSEILRKKFQENTGYDSVVIPNYIRLPQVKKPSGKSDFVSILSVGDMTDPVKNFSGLLRAFSAALSRNTNLRLTLIGGGPDEAYIRSLISSFGLEEFVHFKGRLPHEDVLEAMASCDFYVCNSNVETFGMTVAEALLSGKPVVSTRCGGPEEFLTDANSLRVDPGDEEALTGAIVQMAGIYSDFDSKQLTAPIASRFGQEAVRASWLSFYRMALSKV